MKLIKTFLAKRQAKKLMARMQKSIDDGTAQGRQFADAIRSTEFGNRWRFLPVQLMWMDGPGYTGPNHKSLNKISDYESFPLLLDAVLYVNQLKRNRWDGFTGYEVQSKDRDSIIISFFNGKGMRIGLVTIMGDAPAANKLAEERKEKAKRANCISD